MGHKILICKHSNFLHPNLVTPYQCPDIMAEEVIETGDKPHSDKVNNKTVVRLTEDTYVEKVRFEGINDTTPVGVLRPKEKGVSYHFLK